MNRKDMYSKVWLVPLRTLQALQTESFTRSYITIGLIASIKNNQLGIFLGSTTDVAGLNYKCGIISMLNFVLAGLKTNLIGAYT